MRLSVGMGKKNSSQREAGAYISLNQGKRRLCGKKGTCVRLTGGLLVVCVVAGGRPHLNTVPKGKKPSRMALLARRLQGEVPEKRWDAGEKLEMAIYSKNKGRRGEILKRQGSELNKRME